jgi:hypothetical protein
VLRTEILAVLHVPLVRFEVLTSVTMKNGVFWDVTPRGSCKNQRFGGTILNIPLVLILEVYIRAVTVLKIEF